MLEPEDRKAIKVLLVVVAGFMIGVTYLFVIIANGM